VTVYDYGHGNFTKPVVLSGPSNRKDYPVPCSSSSMDRHSPNDEDYGRIKRQTKAPGNTFDWDEED
jgi:hypothetical protein